MLFYIIITVGFTLMPLLMLAMYHRGFYRGNAKKYSASRAKPKENSPLKGKTIIFLGSSVTCGASSRGESFVEYLRKQDGIVSVKEAVAGTSLVETGKKSYLARLKKIDPGIRADAFVCQLPVCDAYRKAPLGKVSKSFLPEDFDTRTVTGAMEYIIAYAKRTWRCPVIFHTSVRFQGDQEAYNDMVRRLLELQKKWGIGVLDLWNDTGMYIVSRDGYRLYMASCTHPTRAGYRDWWTPKFEAYLTDYLMLS